MRPSAKIAPPEQLVNGRIYKLRCRNLDYGVWCADKEAFIGIREKFWNYYLDLEYHWNASFTFGTVFDAVDAGVDVPNEFPLDVHDHGPHGTRHVDQNGRYLWKDDSLENPMGWSWTGWYRYEDTDEICPKYKEDGFNYFLLHNDRLFKFLSDFTGLPWERFCDTWRRIGIEMEDAKDA